MPVILEAPKEGNRTKSEHVTHVLTVNGWAQIVPGSFKLLQVKTNSGASIPFVVFNQHFADDEGNVNEVTVELTSPSSLHAVAYPTVHRDDA